MRLREPDHEQHDTGFPEASDLETGHHPAHEDLLQIRDALLPARQGMRDGKNHHVDGIILLTERLVKDLDAACDALDAAS
ncbi:hypothetical protein APT_01686 [Acetobacter pasteurianus NBRC 101655]|nr:hypothetical protein APT_01686 [Acetobacter pasteurianus NBRC 101655]